MSLVFVLPYQNHVYVEDKDERYLYDDIKKQSKLRQELINLFITFTSVFVGNISH